MFVGGFGYPGYRRFFLANVGRNRPEAERRRPKADATSGNRERKLQPETAQEKPLAPRVGFGRPALEIMAVFEEKWQKAKETIKERGIFISGKLRHGPQFFTQKSEGGGLSLNAFALES